MEDANKTNEQKDNTNTAPAEVLKLFAPYEFFCKSMIDAYIIVDAQGKIVKCNQLFSQISGQSTKAVLKTNHLNQVLSFEIKSNPWTFDDLKNLKTPTRVDEVTGKNSQETTLNLILGIYPFVDTSTNEFKGAFLLIRDATAEAALQGKYNDKAKKSITDTLTSLFTRAYFEEYLHDQMKHLVAAPKEDANRMSLAILDIDFFKKVNDKYGHQAGDHVLKTVSGIIKNTFRKTDIPCRYGGEEFLVILPGTDLKGAVVACDKLRAAVEAEKIVFNDQHIPVTISSGVAEIFAGKEKYEDTIARADLALYESKRAGRNRVTYHDGEGIKANVNPSVAA